MTEAPLARQFAKWGATLCAEDIPDNVILCARRAMLDTLGVIAAGSVHLKVKSLGKNITVASGKSTTTTGHRTDAVAAATINSMAGHVLGL